jgi:hypothetical protein
MRRESIGVLMTFNMQLSWIGSVYGFLASVNWGPVGSWGGWVGAVVSGCGFWLAIRRWKADREKDRLAQAEKEKQQEQAQWRYIYRIMKQILSYASLVHATSAEHSLPARQLGEIGIDILTPYAQAAEGLTFTIGSLLMELTLIPQGAETLALLEFFGIKYRTMNSRARGDFAEGLNEMNQLVLAKAGGKPLEMPKAWQETWGKPQTPPK